MFSVGIMKNAMVINAIGTRRISFQNIDKLRKLVLQGIRTKHENLIIDLQGVRFIDSESFSKLEELYQIAEKRKSHLAFANINVEVKELFNLIPETKKYNIVNLPVLEEESVITEFLTKTA
jgi:anti-anti-sigma factor